MMKLACAHMISYKSSYFQLLRTTFNNNLKININEFNMWHLCCAFVLEVFIFKKLKNIPLIDQT